MFFISILFTWNNFLQFFFFCWEDLNSAVIYFILQKPLDGHFKELIFGDRARIIQLVNWNLPIKSASTNRFFVVSKVCSLFTSIQNCEGKRLFVINLWKQIYWTLKCAFHLSHSNFLQVRFSIIDFNEQLQLTSDHFCWHRLRLAQIIISVCISMCS